MFFIFLLGFTEILPFLRVLLRVNEGLTQLRGHAHAGKGEFRFLERIVAPLRAGKVQRQGVVADQQHFIGIFAVELDE